MDKMIEFITNEMQELDKTTTMKHDVVNGGPMVDQFKLANIQLTDEQREAMIVCSRAFHGFTDAMIMVVQDVTLSIAEFTKALMDCIQQPEKDFTQKHKPWKKDRFYY